MSESLFELVRILDPQNSAERYDLIAEAFWRKHHVMAPGKSVPHAMGAYSKDDEERRHKLWGPFIDEWYVAHFAKLYAMVPKDPERKECGQ